MPDKTPLDVGEGLTRAQRESILACDPTLDALLAALGIAWTHNDPFYERIRPLVVDRIAATSERLGFT